MFWIKRAIQFRNIQYFKVTSAICIIPRNQFSTYSKLRLLHTKISFRELRSKNYERICGFHTTSRLHIPPLFAVILRPVLKIGAFLVGRGIKQWWKKKSPEEREKYKLLLKENSHIFLGSLGILCLICIIYYITHIEIEPITKRKRFIMFNRKEQAELGKMIVKMHLEEHKDSIVPHDHPVYKRLIRIIKNILLSNRDINFMNEKEWTLTIIDSPLKNAYVLPERNIFFFSGALSIVDNDDQLTFIMAHEIAHALLLHSIEQLSNAVFIDILLTIPLLLLWALFPDLIALILHILVQYAADVLHNLPYSRALENEADDVGLMLAAKACADIREAVVFWGVMRILSEMNLEMDPIPWLSTHPAHGEREQKLNSKLKEAIALMRSSGCPALSSRDPRKEFYDRTLKDHEIYFRKKGLIPTGPNVITV